MYRQVTAHTRREAELETGIQHTHGVRHTWGHTKRGRGRDRYTAHTDRRRGVETSTDRYTPHTHTDIHTHGVRHTWGDTERGRGRDRCTAHLGSHGERQGVETGIQHTHGVRHTWGHTERGRGRDRCRHRLQHTHGERQR